MSANEQVLAKRETLPNLEETPDKERLAYTLLEVADMIGVDYLSVYRLIQRKKLKACRALRGKFLVTRTELLRMLNKE